jgi:dipeptidase D
MVRIEINHFIHDLENHFLKTEPKLRVDLESTDLQQYAMPRELTQKLIRALQECPHGVIEMNSENPNLVDTSTNLAAISTQPDYIEIETSQRSANENRKQAIAEKVAAIFASIGAEISRGKDYPGWEPNFNSDILEVSKNAYQKLYNKTPIVKTIHAGLECGVILKKHPNLDMISIGPTIENAHSPSEQVHIDSVRKCWDLLIEILQSA